MLSRDRAGEEEALLRDDPELATERLLRDVAHVVAVDRDRAGAGVVEAGEELRDRRLAGSRVADERDGRPGGDVEVEVVEHVGEVAVPEAHVIEPDVTVDTRKHRALRAVDDLRLLVEHVVDPVERGRRREERVVELRELLHRVEEVRQVERERQERADGEIAVDDERSAEAEHDRDRHGREDVDDREVDAVQDDRLVVRRAVALVDPTERRLAHRLAGERLDDPHARDVLRERGGHEPEALADVSVGAVRARPEPGGRSGHERKDEERREREPPVEEEEHDGRSHEDERVLDEARHAVGDEQVERLDVVRDPADDRAGAIPLVEAERQALEVVEEPDPEVGEGALADPAREVGLRAREDEGGDARGDEGDDDDRELVEVLRGDAVVDGELREVRREERDERVGDERDARERGSQPVRPREADERAEPSARLAPRPVVDTRAPLVAEMAARLPDLHRGGSRRGTPSHHPLPAYRRSPDGWDTGVCRFRASCMRTRAAAGRATPRPRHLIPPPPAAGGRARGSPGRSGSRRAAPPACREPLSVRRPARRSRPRARSWTGGGR